ncbi:hypothetical protein C1I58_16200 [Bacillus sp. PIC28]|uniref:Uncharacterized protein n=1 Tax=Bacillus cereus TaxID=1396 RepID=A0A9Q5QR12_BACCE|nr:hypothetical protein CPZ31_22805 [Bacillus cereus]AZR79360.1 hypothetical protein BtSCAC15_24730 [Bacillus thuringiensis]KAA0757317.1 hypothetical protein DN401_06155 [Bacillus sp. BF2-3]OLR82747.1 hypothetical protein BTO25_09950 [Bacillus sp. MB366]OTY72570.1 hypothetical protein BK753_08875 [Bacillus thuringiensis serovar canadensis]QCC42676.1 hypothetical protein C3Y97_23555 [Bacillus sp. DU-106]TKV46823.1 hypothetical protein C1I58_16200 [Bacillus sp. PIC28]
MFIPPINVAIFSRTHIHQMIMKIIIIVNGKCEIYKFFSIILDSEIFISKHSKYVAVKCENELVVLAKQ